MRADSGLDRSYTGTAPIGYYTKDQYNAPSDSKKLTQNMGEFGTRYYDTQDARKPTHVQPQRDYSPFNYD